MFHLETHIIQALLKTFSPIPKSSLTWYSGLHLWCAIRRVDDGVRVVNPDLRMMPTILVPLYLILQEDISHTRALSKGISRQYLGPYWSSLPHETPEHQGKAAVLQYPGLWSTCSSEMLLETVDQSLQSSIAASIRDVVKLNSKLSGPSL